jgi:hypothetical protein
MVGRARPTVEEVGIVVGDDIRAQGEDGSDEGKDLHCDVIMVVVVDKADLKCILLES